MRRYRSFFSMVHDGITDSPLPAPWEPVIRDEYVTRTHRVCGQVFPYVEVQRMVVGYRRQCHMDRPANRGYELESATRQPHGGIRAVDTRRFRSDGKQLGNHNGHWKGVTQRFVKRVMHKAERKLGHALAWDENEYRAWKTYAKALTEVGYHGT